MVAPPVTWTREHTLAAFHLYTLLPFGRLHRLAPEIQQLASWEGSTPNSLAMKLSNFASLDPAITGSGRKGLPGATNQDRELWDELQRNWDAVAHEAANAYNKLAMQNGIAGDTELLEDAIEEIPEGKTRSLMVEVRVNQARFRTAVLTSYNSTCCMSGIQHEKLVIASHIVPWSIDTKNRLNPQNGLCLSALHDRAYDQGLITVMPDYTIRLSKNLNSALELGILGNSFSNLQNKLIQLPQRLKPNPIFLEQHARRFGYYD